MDEQKLAEDHAEWFAETTKWIYKQAFLHGYKHGKGREEE